MIQYALSLLSGVLLEIENSGRRKYLQEIAGFLNGLILYAISSFPGLTALVVGGIIGVMIAGKINKRGHYISTATFFLLYAISPRVVYVIPLIVFSVAAYVDEIFSGRKDILGRRIVMPLASLAMYPLMGVEPILAILAFGIGYRSTSLIYTAKQGVKQPS